MSIFAKIFAGFTTSEKKLPRSPRVLGELLRDLKIHIKNGDEFIQKVLINVSKTGFLLEDTGDYKLDQELTGYFEFQGKRIDINAKVVRLSTNQVAARVTGPLARFGAFLEGFFAIELAAAQPSFVPSPRLKEDPDGTPFWVISRDGYSLFYVVHNGELKKYSVQAGEELIRRDLNKNLKVYAIQNENVSALNYKASDLLQENIKSAEVVKVAIRYIKGLNGVDEKIKNEILGELELII